jgi:xanthine dehydrogenase accessory factor
MSETAEVLSAITSLRERGGRMALGTIVSVRGSTYRRPGARLLVPEKGDSIGNLSGGCLEGEVEQVARTVMVDGVPRLESYDLTADDEVVWGWGLGCNGVIEVFVEPADNAAQFADALRVAIEEERTVAAATVLESRGSKVRPGARVLVHEDGRTEGGMGDGPADAVMIPATSHALANGSTLTTTLALEEGELRVFIEVIQPPPRLVVCGAGHDAIPVVRLAGLLGWRVIVADDRESLLDRQRFPGAGAFVKTEPVKAAVECGVDGRTFVVVMTHNFLRDKDYLRSFLGSDVAYVGMLGPAARLQRLCDNLSEEGVPPKPKDLARIHSPAGLDIGAEGPEEIAVAIVSEILAVQRDRKAGFLRDRKGPIHERSPQEAWLASGARSRSGMG